MERENRQVEDYFPFIIKVVSEITGRYVEVENSIELSIALEKFIYANTTFDDTKGKFLSYLKVVIRNGLIDYYRKNKNTKIESDEKITELIDKSSNESSLHDQAEMNMYDKALKQYKLSFDKMAKVSPTHKSTRLRLIELTKLLAKDEVVLAHIKKKKRVPITYVCSNYDVTLKVIKTHQKFIIGIMVAYIEEIDIVLRWINQV